MAALGSKKRGASSGGGHGVARDVMIIVDKIWMKKSKKKITNAAKIARKDDRKSWSFTKLIHMYTG